MFEIRVKRSKRVTFEWEGQQRLLERLGKKAAAFLRERISRLGVDADGRRLPELEDGGWWYTSPMDTRFSGPGFVFRRANRKTGGKAVLKVFLAGYKDLKRQRSGKAHRGADLTGALWKSLAVKVGNMPGGHRVQVYFTGSQVTGLDPASLDQRGRPKRKRVDNRDKAVLLMYARRNARGEPVGAPDFALMRLAPAELARLRDEMLRKVRVLKNR